MRVPSYPSAIWTDIYHETPVELLTAPQRRQIQQQVYAIYAACGFPSDEMTLAKPGQERLVHARIKAIIIHLHKDFNKNGHHVVLHDREELAKRGFDNNMIRYISEELHPIKGNLLRAHCNALAFEDDALGRGSSKPFEGDYTSHYKLGNYYAQACECLKADMALIAEHIPKVQATKLR